MPTLSNATSNAPASGKNAGPVERRCTNGKSRAMHRIGIVRRQQGISQRMAAQLLSKELDEIKGQERKTSDLKLSEIYRWQKILDVPIIDLLVDSREITKCWDPSASSTDGRTTDRDHAGISRSDFLACCWKTPRRR